LEKRTTETVWMSTKYGREVKPWFENIKTKNDKHGLNGPQGHAPDKVIKYRFGKKGPDQHNQIHWEPEHRNMVIQAPDTYQGSLGQQGSKYFINTDKCWIVNGFIHKANGNFREQFFIKKVSIIGNSIYVGAAPTDEANI